MADDKKLSFESKVDTKGLSAMKASLKDLSTGTDAFKKSIGLLTGELVKLDKELALKIKDFKSFANIINSSNKDIINASKAIEKYTSAWNKMQMAIGGRQVTTNSGSSTSNAGYSYVNQANGGVHGGSSQTNPVYVAIVGGGTGGQFVPLPGGNYGNIPPQGRNGRVQSGYQQVGGALESAGGFISGIQDRKNLALSNFASIQQNTYGKILNQLAGGDFSSMLALQRKSTFNNIENASGRKAMAVGQLTSDVGRFMGTSATGIASGNIGGVTDAAQNAVMNQWNGQVNGGYQAKEASTMGQALDLSAQTRPMDKIMMQHLASTAAQRLALTRSVGGNMEQVNRARDQYGISLGESQGLFGGLSEKYGATAAMGSVGGTTTTGLNEAWQAASTINPATGQRLFHPSQKDQFLNSPSMQKATNQMFPITTTTTKGIRSLGENALELGQYGFDKDKMGDILGTLQMGIGGNKGQAGEQAMRKLESIFRRATAAGIEDTALATKIGESVAQNQFSAAGVLSNPENIADAVINSLRSLGPNATAHDIDTATRGFGKITEISKNDPVLSSMKLAHIKSLGITDPAARQALLSATAEELESGSTVLNETLGTDEQAIKQRRSVLNFGQNSLSSFNTRGNSLSGKIKKRMKELGTTDEREAIRKDPQIARWRGTLTYLSKSGEITADEAIRGAEVNAWSGISMPEDVKGRIGKGKIEAGGILEQQGIAQAKIDLKIQDEEVKNASKILQALASASVSFSTLADKSPDWEAASSTFEALQELILVIQNDPNMNQKIKDLEDQVKKKKR